MMEEMQDAESVETPMMNMKVSTKKKKKLPKKQSVVVKKTQKERDIEKEVREYRLDPQVQMEREIVKKGEAIEKMGGADFADTADRIKSGLDPVEAAAKQKMMKMLPKKR